MDIVATCLSGIVAKVYDDLTDNHIIGDGFLKESLHTLSCILLGASAMNDFTYAVFLYIINLSVHFSEPDCFSQMHEKTILYMYPVLFLLTLSSIRALSVIEILCLITILPGAFVEASGIKEEVSIRKLMIRMFIVVVCGVIVLAGVFFGFLTRSLLKILLFFMSYLLSSCFFQLYELFLKKIHYEDKPML
jgi:hypothetical protein